MPADKEGAALAAAAEWFARLGDDAADEAERQRWRDWLAADPGHAQAWARVEAIAQPFAQLRAAAGGPSGRQALAEARRAPRRQALRVLGLGALALGGYGLLGSELPRSAYWAALAAWRSDQRTGIGQTRHLELADGSRLSLNTATRVRIDYSDEWRRIQLFDGEILLDSGIDRRARPRPLIVDTRHGRVTALGTRFSVRGDEAATRVDVFDGAVRIAPFDDAGTLLLPAGRSARFTAARSEAAGPAAAAREGWADGLLIADDLPLPEFVAELARYTPLRLETGPGTAALRLTGVYRIGQPARDLPAILAAIEASLPLRADSPGPGRVRLVAR